MRQRIHHPSSPKVKFCYPWFGCRNEKKNIKVGLSVAPTSDEVQNAVIPLALALGEKNETFTRPLAVDAACKLKPSRQRKFAFHWTVVHGLRYALMPPTIWTKGRAFITV